MSKKIVVIGSSNTDLVARASHFPIPGETVMGDNFGTFAGGKGANQAVACSRAGGEVSFIAKLGLDGFGDKALDGFEKDNIGTAGIRRDADEPSGVALITVDHSGQNSIVVAPGANNKLSPEDIDESERIIEDSQFVLIQLEIPIQTVEYAVRRSAESGKKVILNPAPAAELNTDTFQNLFLITPNESEATLLSGVEVIDLESTRMAAQALLDKGVQNVIITLGSNGAYFQNKDMAFHTKARETKVIDTTAAGDIFNGALCVALAEDKDWGQAIQFANIASSIGVSRMGAQNSAPSRDEIDDILNQLDG